MNSHSARRVAGRVERAGTVLSTMRKNGRHSAQFLHSVWKIQGYSLQNAVTPTKSRLKYSATVYTRKAAGKEYTCVVLYASYVYSAPCIEVPRLLYCCNH